MEQTALSVGQLHRKAKNALAREFRGYVWVQGEVKSIREQRGSWYISLVEPGDYADGGDISVDVACWPKRRLVVQSQLDGAGIRLAAGMEVRVYGTVSLSKVGRLQLEMHALDTESLIGKQATEKRRLYKALEQEGLLERNKRLVVPTVPLRVGLVTSDGSDGFRDFMGQLEHSSYAFAVSFAHAPVQGPTAPNVIARAITDLCSADLDLIAVVRGGGGELDAFDKEPVARAIATSRFPVWCGIGHTSDRSVADDIANRSFITPTACGQAIVEVVRMFVDRYQSQAIHLRRVVEKRLNEETAVAEHSRRHLSRELHATVRHAQTRLHRSTEALRLRASHVIEIEQGGVRAHAQALRRSSEASLTYASMSLAHSRVQASVLDPRRQLERGYVLIKNEAGGVVRRAHDVAVGAPLRVMFADGEVSSTVTRVTITEEKQT